MLENTTVKLLLQDFDTLREGERAHRRIAERLAKCFSYSCEKIAGYAEPKECKKCESDTDCLKCEHYTPEYDEKLTVDVGQLIKVAKQYALYGKEVEIELDEVRIERVDA